MAQAARLNLRMQKELKLLLTDPPPGASFPLLSDSASASSSSSSFSLSSIDALIEGPEGTVYAKGVFQIKIQIPERYPFQPPSVTFATPIYHPNIDTGGRICLDILNLPPKGAWQPSLNISTVLTSIGLLLSEPNPDDGLMCEASREYKYNRQAFDQKARSMTEKYAKAGASENIGGCSQGVLSSSRPSMMESEGHDEEPKREVIDHTIIQKRPCGISRKLSLEFSSSTQKKDCDGEVNGMPNHLVRLSNFENHIEIEEQNKETDSKIGEYNSTCAKLPGTRRKLSLESLGQSQKRDADYQENVLPNTHSSNLKPQSQACSESCSVMQASNHLKHPHQDQDGKSIKDSLSVNLKKPCHVFQRPSLESLGQSQKRDADYQENVLPNTHSSNLKPQSQACSESCSVMQASNHLKHPHQDQDGKSIKDSLSVSSKKPCHVFQRPSSEFSDMPQIIDGTNQKPQVVNHNELKPLAEAEPIASRSRHGFGDTKCGKLSLVGKKLSLGFKRSSQIGENDNKENVDPNPNLPLQQDGGAYALRAGDSGMSASNKKRGTGHNDRKLSMNHYTTPSKSLPMPHDISCDWKPQSSQDHDEVIAGGIMEKSPLGDALIVLDSEDSEEERNDECLRPKLSLTRRRLAGKWRS